MDQSFASASDWAVIIMMVWMKFWSHLGQCTNGGVHWADFIFGWWQSCQNPQRPQTFLSLNKLVLLSFKLLTEFKWLYCFLGPDKVGSTVVKTKVLRGVSAGYVATLHETIHRVIRNDRTLPTTKLASFSSDGDCHGDHFEFFNGDILELERDSMTHFLA